MTAALGWLGSALVIASLTQRDVRRLRQLNLAAAVVLGVFNIAVGIASMIALNVVLAAINAYHLRPRRPSRPAAALLPLPDPTTRRAVTSASR